MKKIVLKSFVALSAAALLSACSWLAEPSPMVTQLDDYFAGAGGQGCQYTINACYVPLCWEFNNSYFSEWFIGDVCSDDALKGGEAVQSGMPYVYYLENFKSIAENAMLLDMFRSNYQGIGRCNLALEQIPAVACDSFMNQSKKDRLLGEAYFLRAYYYYRLVRLFGGVPISTKVQGDGEAAKLPRATLAETYKQIIDDFTKAESMLWVRSELDGADLGRATKGAAQAMLMKIYMMRHQAGDYELAKQWGDKVIASNEYDLVADYGSNFTLAGENNIESLFEIQYSEEASSDYGDKYSHLGSTRGTFSLVLTRGRKYGGWAWNHPTQNLVDEFEAEDARLGASVFDPGNNIETRDVYLGNSYLNAKTGDYVDWPGTSTGLHDSRGPLNYKQIRYSDVLLMHAEACIETGNTALAQQDLEKVRSRARSYAQSKGAAETVLPEFPNYTIKKNGLQEVQPTLLEAVRHERRVELAMEGIRWFDLMRWEQGAAVMNAYRAAESAQVRTEMNEFITGIHELFPIPPKEIQLNPNMTQNPGY